MMVFQTIFVFRQNTAVHDLCIKIIKRKEQFFNLENYTFPLPVNVQITG